MIRVRIFCEVYGDSEYMHKQITEMWGESWPLGSITPQVVFVQDDSYTHACIINIAKPNIILPRSNVIGLAFEPLICLGLCFWDNEYYKYIDECIQQYNIGLIGELNTNTERSAFREDYGFIPTPFWRDNLHTQHPKKHLMSIIVSNQKAQSGHVYRHDLVNEILKTNMDIHIWGRGSLEYSGSEIRDSRIKGSFDKSEPYSEYVFTIVIENTASQYYISEKVIAPISCNCIPIYFGAGCIDNILGHCCWKLNGGILHDIEMIKKIYYNPDPYVFSLNGPKEEVERGRACLPKYLYNFFTSDK